MPDVPISNSSPWEMDASFSDEIGCPCSEICLKRLSPSAILAANERNGFSLLIEMPRNLSEQRGNYGKMGLRT